MTDPTPSRTPGGALLDPFVAFLRMEAAGGIVLMACALAAMAWANSPWAAAYHAAWSTPLTVGLGDFALTKPVLLWINDGLMAVFFFVIGLEIKREVLVGGLSTPGQTIMPVAAALGGMAVPALIFAAFNAGGEAARGWGIPMATDIAFALGILSLLGRRAPTSLKVYLTAVAIVDDIGAILVIALFYSTGLSWAALGLGLAGLAAMAALNLVFRVRRTIPYLVLGILVWLAFLKSGIHATIAGVLAALTIPASTRMDGKGLAASLRRAADELDQAGPDAHVLTCTQQQRVLHRLHDAHHDASTPLTNLEHALHPWVAFAIMPVFALANAGVTLRAEVLAGLVSPLSLGIVAGLVAGAPIGVVGCSWLVQRLGWARYPEGTSFRHVLGAGCLAGVGFTMSIFIANLAFEEGTSLDELSKVAVLAASVLAGLIGYALLRLARE